MCIVSKQPYTKENEHTLCDNRCPLYGIVIPHINLSGCGLVEVEIKKANIVTCDGNICSHTRHVGLLEIDRRSYDEESEYIYIIFKAQ